MPLFTGEKGIWRKVIDGSPAFITLSRRNRTKMLRGSLHLEI
jgi:hypothetical protein